MFPRLRLRSRVRIWPMDSVTDLQREISGRTTGGDVSVAFAVFVFAHAGCGDEVLDSRVDEDSVECWCLRCDEMRIFGPPE